MKQKYKAKIKRIPDHIVYYKQYTVEFNRDFYDLESNSNILQDLSDRVLAENPEVKLAEEEYCVLVYLNGDYSNKNQDIEFCDEVTDFGKDCGEYKFKKVKGFIAVTVLHKGSFETIGNAYEFAYAWMKQNNYVKAGCPRDSAINGPWNKSKEEDYLTEIQIPITF